MKIVYDKKLSKVTNIRWKKYTSITSTATGNTYEERV